MEGGGLVDDLQLGSVAERCHLFHRNCSIAERRRLSLCGSCCVLLHGVCDDGLL